MTDNKEAPDDLEYISARNSFPKLSANRTIAQKKNRLVVVGIQQGSSLAADEN